MLARICKYTLLVSGGLGLVSFVACSTNSGTTTGPGLSGGTGATGGATGQGGTGGGSGAAGGAGAVGGSGATGGVAAGGSGGTVGGQAGTGSGGTSSSGLCCGGLGTCVATSTVPTNLQPDLGQDTCAQGYLCAPTAILSGQALQVCTSVDNTEGRCAPNCLPPIQQVASFLPSAGCPTGDLCAPCYNPINGSATGICTLNGDQPTQQPKVWVDCGGGRGQCLPYSILPTDRRDKLPQDTCASGYKCVPKEVLSDPNYQWPTCTTTLYGGGVCVPSYLGQGQPITLTRDNCANPDDVCAPCTVAGVPTGACG